MMALTGCLHVQIIHKNVFSRVAKIHFYNFLNDISIVNRYIYLLFIKRMLQSILGNLRQRLPVELKELIRGAHSLVEAKEKRRVTQEDMAGRIGVSHRAFMEYERGTNAPLAMKALLNLLVMLNDQEIVRVVREWGEKEVTDDDHQQN